MKLKKTESQVLKPHRHKHIKHVGSYTCLLPISKSLFLVSPGVEDKILKSHLIQYNKLL